jgi:hypothetical protein
MIPRRRVLKIVAATLLAGNIAFLGWRLHEAAMPNAAITYAGLDSLALEVPRNQPAGILRGGKWQPDPATDARVRVSAETQTRRFLPVVVISLGPKPSYGRFIESVRSLRARHICHVAIMEGAAGVPEMERGYTPEGFLEIPTILLCGEPIGDAASFDGKLPPDAVMRL